MAACNPESSTANATSKRQDRPSIAVVICTRDRPDALRETLESVWRQSRRPDELIIVDDGRLADEFVGELAERCRGLGIPYKYHRKDVPGLTRSRNVAADIAESEILQYLDDDVTCEPGFLAEVERLMRDPLVGGVTATVREPAFESLRPRLYQVGYRLAGWWQVRPRGRPHVSRPVVLSRPDVAVEARWLSGAAMALRRDIVRQHRFDEDLSDYALGEDREMGYRLASRCWLIEARKARVVHRREPGERGNPHRLGFMTSHNYLYILSKTCRLGVGDWLLIGWGLAVLAAMHAIWGLLGGRRSHFAELRGMAAGVARFFISRFNADGEQSRDREGAVKPRTCRPSQSLGDRSLTVAALTGRYTPNTYPAKAGDSCRKAAVPLRVLFVTTSLDAGGAERMLLSLAERLPAHGIKPFIACLKHGGVLASECRDRGIRVFEDLLHFKTDAAVLIRLHRILIENGIDVVVAAHSGGDRMFWSTLAARMLDLPMVVWSHWFPTPRDRHVEPANRALYRWIDAFVALGRRHRLALIRHAHVPAGRVTVIPNAIDIERFAPGCSRAEARQRLRLEDAHVVVAIIANMRPEKRHDVFIQAAAQLARESSSYRFLIIGDGPDRDAVQAWAASSRLDHEILRLLGRREDVASILPGIDICCLCSEVECFSVIMLEAAAAGCAFIGPDVGCLGEFLEHRRTGLVIKPADAASLADGVRELANDAGLRRQLVEAAGERLRRHFGMERMVEAFAGLFRRLRNQRGTAAQRTSRTGF